MTAFNSVVCAIGANLIEMMKTDVPVYKIVIEKSTVPLGTAQAIKSQLCAQLKVDSNRLEQIVTVVNMPEFLAEGSAINDLVNP
jgi:UDP-glucose 6-dehydrogenase